MGKVSRRVYKRNKKRYTKKRYTRKRYQKKNRRTLKRKKYTKQKGGVCLRGLCKKYVTMDVLLLDSNTKEDKNKVKSLGDHIRNKEDRDNKRLLARFVPPSTGTAERASAHQRVKYLLYNDKYVVDNIKTQICIKLNTIYSLKKHLLLDIFKQHYNTHAPHEYIYNEKFIEHKKIYTTDEKELLEQKDKVYNYYMNEEGIYPSNMKDDIKYKLKKLWNDLIYNGSRRRWSPKSLNEWMGYGRVRIIHNILLEKSPDDLYSYYVELQSKISPRLKSYYEDNKDKSWNVPTFDRYLLLVQHSGIFTGEYSIIDSKNSLINQYPPISWRSFGMRNFLYVIPRNNLYVNSDHREYKEREGNAGSLDGIKFRTIRLMSPAFSYPDTGYGQPLPEGPW